LKDEMSKGMFENYVYHKSKRGILGELEIVKN
jgi:hypothetical protein